MIYSYITCIISILFQFMRISRNTPWQIVNPLKSCSSACAGINLAKLIMFGTRLICFGALWGCAMDLQGLNTQWGGEWRKSCCKIYFLLNFASEEGIHDILHLKVNEILPQIVVYGPINSLPHFLRKFLFVPALRKLGSIWQNGRCNTSQARETRNLFKSYQYNVGCDDLMHQFWCKFIQGEQIELANRDMRLPCQNSGWNSTRPVFI